MVSPKRIDTSLDAMLWILCIQYYVVQLIVAFAWMTPYNLTQNTISDLGNTACGTYGGRLVCSPLHALMNVSFIILGILMISGSILLFRAFNESPIARAAFTFIAIAGLGTIVVGMFPENTIRTLHIVGAALPFVIGNIGLLSFGFVLGIPRALRNCAMVFGLVSLATLVLFVTHHYVGIGLGGTERVVAYPQTIWLIIFGVYEMKVHSGKDRG